MYRLIFTIVLCLKVASPAPQAKESDVTYVKIQPLIEDTPLEAATSTRESRIEKLPLTIPGIITSEKEPDKTIEKPEDNQSEIVSEEKSENNKTELSETKSNSSEIANLSEDKSELNLSENLDPSESIQSDSITDPNDPEESITTDDLSEVSPTDDLSISHSDKLADTVPSETNLSDRRGKYFDSIETTETIDDATFKYEELIDHTILEEPRTKPPPKFIPKTPKLSYYPKPRAFHSYSANHLDIIGKRKFKSRCSCQKIWNCPKLQISVPRCPNEYFLCCF